MTMKEEERENILGGRIKRDFVKKEWRLIINKLVQIKKNMELFIYGVLLI